MSHIYHPDTHTHGLCDDCPECVWKAEHGQGFDQRNLHRLMVAREHYTVTDQKAHAKLLELHPHLEKRGTESPGLLPRPGEEPPETDADLTVQQLANVWRMAWLVARRRLVRPEVEDLVTPVTNIVEALEEVTAELFRRLDPTVER